MGMERYLVNLQIPELTYARKGVCFLYLIFILFFFCKFHKIPQENQNTRLVFFLFLEKLLTDIRRTDWLRALLWLCETGSVGKGRHRQ